MKFVSKNRKERIIAIADELSNTEEYDIITLQEIWVYADYEYVRESVTKYLPYAKFFYRLVNIQYYQLHIFNCYSVVRWEPDWQYSPIFLSLLPKYTPTHSMARR